MSRTVYATHLRAFISVCLLVFMTACASEKASKPAPKPLPPVAGAERLYAQNLSLARMALIQSQDSLQNALPYINKLNAYALGPHRENVTFMIVQLYFTQKGTGTKYVAFAPIAPAGTAPSRFESLDQLMDVLRTFNPEYYRIQVRDTHFAKLQPISVWRTDATAARTEVNQIYSVLNTNAKMLDTTSNAAFKLELTEFFIDQRARDAAYLSLESAKAMLALATQQKNADSAEIKRLTQELTRVENTLNKKLPYKW